VRQHLSRVPCQTALSVGARNVHTCCAR
jgi:hypothetical protein